MEREYQYLLRLLGAYLREEEPPVWESVDWVKCPDEQTKFNLHRATYTLLINFLEFAFLPFFLTAVILL